MLRNDSHTSFSPPKSEETRLLLGIADTQKPRTPGSALQKPFYVIKDVGKAVLRGDHRPPKKVGAAGKPEPPLSDVDHFKFCTTIVLALLFLWGVSTFVSPNPAGLHPCPTESSPENTSIEGIFRICVSKCDIQMMCISLASAITVARWQGPQFIVTDQPARFQRECDLPNLKFVEAPEYQTLDPDWPQRQNSIYRLEVKEAIWDILAIPKERRKGRLLLYADSDLLFTTCIDDKAGPGPNKELAFFPDSLNMHWNEFNMGVSYSKPEASACFHEVLVEMRADVHNAREQVAMDRVRANGGCRRIKRITRLRMNFVTNDLMTPRIKPFLSFLSGYGSPLFAHYGHATRRQWYWPRVVDRFITDIRAVDPEGAKMLSRPAWHLRYPLMELLFWFVLGCLVVIIIYRWDWLRWRSRAPRPKTAHFLEAIALLVFFLVVKILMKTPFLKILARYR